MDKTESCYSVISHKLGPNSRVYTILKMMIRSCVPHIATPIILSMFDVYHFERRKEYDKICIAINALLTGHLRDQLVEMCFLLLD